MLELLDRLLKLLGLEPEAEGSEPEPAPSISPVIIDWG